MRVALALARARVRLSLDPQAAMRAPAARPAGRGPRTGAYEIAATVRLWKRVVPGATCLVQAIAAQELLAESGHSSQIFFGVTRGANGLCAHAWVEVEGDVVVGEGPQGHTVLGSLPRVVPARG